jgi:RhoGEF domain
MKERRGLIRGEIVSTEAVYTKNIEFIVERFVYPLQSKAQKLGVSPEHVKILCSNLAMLVRLHQEVLTSMTRKKHPKIERIFIKHADFFKIYVQYINNFEKMLDVFNELYEQRSFRQWMSNHVAISHLDIMSYFIMPVQRLPRYVLLLREMEKRTPQEHRSHPLLLLAVQRMEEIAEAVNQHKEHFERIEAVVQVQKLINHPLVEPTRFLVFDGPVSHQTTGFFGKIKHQDIHAFVFNDILVWSKKEPSYAFLGKMQLASAHVSMYNKNPCGFIVSNSKIALILIEADDGARRNLLHAIRDCIDSSRALRQDQYARNVSHRKNTSNGAGAHMHRESITGLQALGKRHKNNKASDHKHSQGNHRSGRHGYVDDADHDSGDGGDGGDDADVPPPPPPGIEYENRQQRQERLRRQKQKESHPTRPPGHMPNLFGADSPEYGRSQTMDTQWLQHRRSGASSSRTSSPIKTVNRSLTTDRFGVPKSSGARVASARSPSRTNHRRGGAGAGAGAGITSSTSTPSLITAMDLDEVLERNYNGSRRSSRSEVTVDGHTYELY